MLFLLVTKYRIYKKKKMEEILAEEEDSEDDTGKWAYIYRG